MSQARQSSAARARSAATRARLAEQIDLGRALSEHLGEPDQGIERALRLGLAPPTTVRELHAALAAASTFLDDSRKLAERSRGQRSQEAVQRFHLQSVAAKANASAYLAIAERAEGFEQIREHCDAAVVSCAALDLLIREVVRRSGKSRAATWDMPTREFAAALDDPWERMRKSEVRRLFDEDIRTLRRRGIIREEPDSSERARHCLVLRSALRPREVRP